MTNLKGIPLAVAVVAAFGLTACSSAKSTPSASGTAAVAAVVACGQVGAALSDGPDPDADPLGYAEAQVIPLRQIHTRDTVLQGAIGKLAAAYQEFFTSNGTKTAKEAVSVASSAINTICPGAAS